MAQVRMECVTCKSTWAQDPQILFLAYIYVIASKVP